MNRRSLPLLLLIGILLASCGPSGPGQPTPDVNGTVNAAAATLADALFKTQTALAPSATNTAIATATSLATATPLSLSTPTTFVQQPVFVAPSATPTGPTPTPLASSLGAGCKNLRLINNWTEPEGPFIAGQQFTQVWHVENNGTCEWLYTFTFEFASGDRTGEATSVRFGSKAPPGEWRQIRVGMRAPNKTGNYKASWRMTDGAGTQFGAGLPVSITVTGSTNTPKPPTATSTPTITPDVAATNAQATANCLGTQAVGGTCPP